MLAVKINSKNPYDVLIGDGLLDSLGSHMKKIFHMGRVAIITDNNVGALYGRRCRKALEEVGFETTAYVIPAGEASKSLTQYNKLMEFLCREQITKTDILVALGGGMVGDLTGFVAATYLRGIPFVQVPTTLLAAVDSSVGGKTAINLACGKNLAGAFYQPKLVVCDCALTATLPENIFRDGCAEVIKYGAIMDQEFYEQLREPLTAKSPNLKGVIASCVRLKESLVRKDEFDQGARQLLNFGHTVGHALESLSNYTITHGLAVAQGMNMMAKISQNEGWCQEKDVSDLRKMLESYNFPLAINYSGKDIYLAMEVDKKRGGDFITLVVMRTLGDCHLKQVPLDTCEKMITQANL